MLDVIETEPAAADGENVVKKKKKNRRKKKKKGSAAGQTTPPSIPVSQLPAFSSGIFPPGEIQEHPGEW